MAKPVARILALQVTLGAAGLLVLGRAAHLQLVRGGELAERARQERTRTREIEARRGTIYDRNGAQLAVTRTKYHVGLALDQVRDTAKVIARVARQVGIRPDSLRRALLARSDVFVSVVAEKLLTYAVGRPMRPEDMPAVRAMVSGAAPEQYKFSSLIMQAVRTPQFQMRTKAVK